MSESIFLNLYRRWFDSFWTVPLLLLSQRFYLGVGCHSHGTRKERSFEKATMTLKSINRLCSLSSRRHDTPKWHKLKFFLLLSFGQQKDREKKQQKKRIFVRSNVDYIVPRDCSIFNRPNRKILNKQHRKLKIDNNNNNWLLKILHEQIRSRAKNFIRKFCNSNSKPK